VVVAGSGRRRKLAVNRARDSPVSFVAVVIASSREERRVDQGMIAQLQGSCMAN
jgi:hypothetical protein